MPTDCPKTSLDELDKVERHLNQGKAFSDWLGIRVYEPERGEEVVWHLRRNPSASLKNILAIGIYEGHAFVIKDIARLAKNYACTHCRSRFTKVCNLQRHFQTCSEGKKVIDCPGERGEARRQLSRKISIQKTTLRKNRFCGLKEKPSGGKSTFTTQCAGTAASVGLSAHLSTGTTMQRRLYFNITAATGTGVENVTRTIAIKSLTATTKRAKIGTRPQ